MGVADGASMYGALREMHRNIEPTSADYPSDIWHVIAGSKVRDEDIYAWLTNKVSYISLAWDQVYRYISSRIGGKGALKAVKDLGKSSA